MQPPVIPSLSENHNVGLKGVYVNDTVGSSQSSLLDPAMVDAYGTQEPTAFQGALPSRAKPPAAFAGSLPKLVCVLTLPLIRLPLDHST